MKITVETTIPAPSETEWKAMDDTRR